MARLLKSTSIQIYNLQAFKTSNESCPQKMMQEAFLALHLKPVIKSTPPR